MRGRVVLGVSGGIAVFRAVEVLRQLTTAGCRVRPILTRNAARFVSPRTFTVLAETAAEVSLWAHSRHPGVDHVDVARWADLLLIVPATANVLAKMASGVADDALTTYAVAHQRAVLVAPAMNTAMWQHPATRNNIEILKGRGVEIVNPAKGFLACGDVGEGKLADVATVVDAALRLLPARGPLAHQRVLITAGATREALDAVRVITNRSSGRMGAALAAAARDLGAAVTLLAGSGVAAPPGVFAERFETAADLGEALARLVPEMNQVWHAAAVADFRPAQPEQGKMDRRGGMLQIDLEPVPDLAAGLSRPDGRPYLVVFAADEAVRMEERAVAKLHAKGADAVVANPIDEKGVGMETPENRALLITRSGMRREFAPQQKEHLARCLLLAAAGEALAVATP